MDQQEQLVSKEVANKLKELGFDWKVLYHSINGDKPQNNFGVGMIDYNFIQDTVSVPTQGHAMKWFRNVHGILVIPDYDLKAKKFFNWGIDISGKREKVTILSKIKYFDTWEKATEEGLLKACDKLQKID